MADSEFKLVLDAVASWSASRSSRARSEIEDEDRIPDELRAQAAEMGLFGYALPEEYGGLGVTMSEDVQLAFEFGYTTPAFRSLFGTNNGIAGQVIAKFGTDEQKQTYLPRLAAGELIGSFALTEAEAGSDPAGLRTTARRDGDEWVINGSKRYITNAPIADLFVVFARSDPAEQRRPGHLQLRRRDHDAGRDRRPQGQEDGPVRRLDRRGLLRRRPRARRRPDRRGGARATRRRSPCSPAAGCTSPRCASAWPSGCSTSRSPTRRPPSRAARRSAGSSWSRACSPTCTPSCWPAAAWSARSPPGYDSGEDTSVGPSSAKLFCTEMVGRAVDRAVQVHGGLGYLRTTPVERFYRDARLFRLYEGTSEVQRLIIGGALLARANKR